FVLCSGDMAHLIGNVSSKVPFWLINFLPHERTLNLLWGPLQETGCQAPPHHRTDKVNGLRMQVDTGVFYSFSYPDFKSPGLSDCSTITPHISESRSNLLEELGVGPSHDFSISAK